jgi:phage terminase small subunit
VSKATAQQEDALDVRLGPKMAALTDKQQRFVRALFDAPRNHGAGTFAARAAGYGTATSSRQSLSSMAHALCCDPKVQAAIAEVSQAYLGALGPIAVRALKKTLNNPKHPGFARALGLVIDRVSPVESLQVVRVEHDVGPTAKQTAEIMARIEALAAKFNVALPPLIEGKAA